MLKHLKHHWKRAASGLMALVMAAGLLPGTSLAAETAATPVIQTEAAYDPTGNFELNVAGTTAWNSGEEPLTVYSTQAGTTQVTEIPAGESFALLEDSGGDRLTIGYSEGGWTGGTLEDTGWVDKDSILVNLPDLIPSIAYVREDAEKAFNSRLTRFEYIIPCPYGEAERLTQLQAEAMDGGETLLVRMEGQTVTITRGVGEPAGLEEYSLDGETYQKYNQWTDSSVDSGISAYQLPYEISTAYSADPSVTLGMFAPQTSQPSRAPSNVTPTGDVGAYNPGSPGGQKPHTSNVAWAIDPERTFLRFTLVEFPGGVVTDLNTMDWNTWHVVGTPLNVVWSNGWSADQCRSDVTWYNSSAMHYNGMGSNAPQLMAGTSVSNGVYSYDATVGYNQRWVTTADEFQAETGITDQQKEQMFHLNSDSWSTGWLNGDYTSMWGTDPQSVTPGNLYQVYKANNAFLYLLGRLTETDNHSGGSNPGWSADEAMEKWSEYVKDKDGNLRTKYRIIVETGMILRDPDGGRRAYTLRDMMAYSLYNNEASQQYNLIWDQSSTTVNMAQWMRQAKEQFLEYPLDENGTPTGEELISNNGFAECDSYVDTIQYARPIRDTIFSERRSFGLHVFSPFNFEHDPPGEPDEPDTPDPDEPDNPEPPDEPDTPGTGIKITKLEEGTTQGLEGAVFKITAPDGSTVGSTYTTGPDGTVTVQLNQTGHFTVEELTPPKWYVKGENSTQHVNVTAGQMAELTKQGIQQVKSAFARRIFRDDLLHVYEQKTEYRASTQREARLAMEELIQQMRNGDRDNPHLEQLTTALALRLQTTKGKKVYGYLPPKTKAIVDEIVDELAKDERVAAAYDLWYQMQEEICRTYSEQPPKRVPFSQQKEFKAVRNMVIQEALRLSQTESISEDLPQGRAEIPNASEPPNTQPDGNQAETPREDDSIRPAAPERSKPSGQEKGPAVAAAVSRMFYHMGRIFEDRCLTDTMQRGLQIDRKRRRQLLEKKMAMGHKADDHENEEIQLK